MQKSRKAATSLALFALVCFVLAGMPVWAAASGLVTGVALISEA